MRLSRPRLPALLLLIAALAGCASQGGARVSRPKRDVIVAEEITRTGATTAREAVELLRPEFLRGRGNSTVSRIPQGAATSPGEAQPQVYVNGVQAGHLEALEAIPAIEVVEIRFLSAADA